MRKKINIELCDVKNFTGEDLQCYNSLLKFYSNYSVDKIKMQKIIDIINKKKKDTVSLRFIESFITHYCKLKKPSITINNEYHKNYEFNIYLEYKSNLDLHKKYYFDPFQRTKKCPLFLFIVNDFSFITNMCQLIYFKWLIEYDILNYIENNYDELNKVIKQIKKYFQKSKSKSHSSTETHSTSTITTTESDVHSLINIDTSSNSSITETKSLPTKLNYRRTIDELFYQII